MSVSIPEGFNIPGLWKLNKINKVRRYDSDVFQDGATFNPTTLEVHYSRQEYTMESELVDTNENVWDVARRAVKYKNVDNISISKYVHKPDTPGTMSNSVGDLNIPTPKGSVFEDAGDWKPVGFNFKFGDDGVGKATFTEGAFDEEWQQDEIRVIPTDVAPNTFQIRKLIDDYKNRSTD
jgi:hypothetical protein